MATAKGKIRNSTEYLIIKKSAELSVTQLPSKKEVLRYFYLLKEKTFVSRLTQAEKSEIVSQVTKELSSIWERASLKTIDDIQIQKMVFRLIEKYESIRRSHNSKSINKNKLNYANELNELFDISSCPCYKPKFGKTIDSSSIKSTDSVCENKIPESEWELYVDQFERRLLFISGSIDKEETKKLKKRERLLERRAERINLHLSKEKKTLSKRKLSPL